MDSTQRRRSKAGTRSRRATLVFLCTGNSCRSPMAEYLLKSMLAPEDGWDVVSAGILQLQGAPACADAVAAMSEIGIDMSGHRSSAATADVLERADMIVAMAEPHVAFVHSIHPDLSGKVRLFTTFDPKSPTPGIPDPIGLPIQAYRETLGRLRAGMPGLLAQMRGLRGKTESA